MNGFKQKGGHLYQFDWDEEEGVPILSLHLPRRGFDELHGVEVVTPLPVWEQKRFRSRDERAREVRRLASPYPWENATRDYVLSSARLVFYTVGSVMALAVSLYLFAHDAYLYLPASILAFVGFTVLALIRLSIHIREHRWLANDTRAKRAA
jgi:hypothetical protein